MDIYRRNDQIKSGYCWAVVHKSPNFLSSGTSQSERLLRETGRRHYVQWDGHKALKDFIHHVGIISDPLEANSSNHFPLFHSSRFPFLSLHIVGTPMWRRQDVKEKITGPARDDGDRNNGDECVRR